MWRAAMSAGSTTPVVFATLRPEVIDREDLRALLTAGELTLIEALPAAYYDAGHLPGARNVPGDLTPELASRLAPDRSATVVIYCSGLGCNRSRTTAMAFLRLGYPDVRIYTGGKSDWA